MADVQTRDDVIYTGNYITTRPPLEKWTDNATQLFMNSPIRQCIAVLSKVRMPTYTNDESHFSDTLLANTATYGVPGCIRVRNITFTNRRNQDNYKYISIYFYYYVDNTFNCSLSLNGDMQDASCLDSTIASLIFPQVKSATTVVECTQDSIEYTETVPSTLGTVE